VFDPRAVRGLGVAIGFVLAGCVLDPVDLSDRRCPCVAGWTCDEVRDRCVPELSPETDGGRREGGHPPLDGAAENDSSSPTDAPAELEADAPPSDAMPPLDGETLSLDADLPLPIDASGSIEDAPPAEDGASSSEEAGGGCIVCGLRLDAS
jgi:hypothetical protein